MSQTPRQTRSSQRQHSLEMNSQSSMDTNGSQPGAQFFEGASGSQDLDLRPERTNQNSSAPSQAASNINAAPSTINPLDRVSSEGKLHNLLPPVLKQPGQKGKSSQKQVTLKEAKNNEALSSEGKSKAGNDEKTKKKKAKELKEVSKTNKISAWYRNRAINGTV